MQPTRRLMLAATGALIAAATMSHGANADPAPAAATDPRMADRTIGDPKAKIVVEEWFSFTCPHCARFESDVYPEVKAQLIDTGKVLYIYHEYPRDQVDLLAAMVARSLPPERYEPFVQTLLSTQMRWAYDRSVNPKDEIAKMAALAGMPREMFDKVSTDDSLKAEILAAQGLAEKNFNIESTPTFIINGKSHAGEVNYETFSKWVGA